MCHYGSSAGGRRLGACVADLQARAGAEMASWKHAGTRGQRPVRHAAVMLHPCCTHAGAVRGEGAARGLTDMLGVDMHAHLVGCASYDAQRSVRGALGREVPVPTMSGEDAKT